MNTHRIIITVITVLVAALLIGLAILYIPGLTKPPVTTFPTEPSTQPATQPTQPTTVPTTPTVPTTAPTEPEPTTVPTEPTQPPTEPTEPPQPTTEPEPVIGELTWEKFLNCKFNGIPLKAPQDPQIFFDAGWAPGESEFTGFLSNPDYPDYFITLRATEFLFDLDDVKARGARGFGFEYKNLDQENYPESVPDIVIASLPAGCTFEEAVAILGVPTNYLGDDELRICYWKMIRDHCGIVLTTEFGYGRIRYIRLTLWDRHYELAEGPIWTD